jgi:hypothetical protein
MFDVVFMVLCAGIIVVFGPETTLIGERKLFTRYPDKYIREHYRFLHFVIIYILSIYPKKLFLN